MYKNDGPQLRNDYERKVKKIYEQYNYPSDQRDRGGCLSFWLGFIILGSGIMILITCATLSSLGQSRYTGVNTGTLQMVLIGTIILQVGILASAIALWNWKKWGYYGLVGGYAITIMLNLCGGNVFAAMFGGLGLGLSIYLVSKIEHLLE